LGWHGILQKVVGRSSLVVGFEADVNPEARIGRGGFAS
jgi:hypothetical protein